MMDLDSEFRQRLFNKYLDNKNRRISLFLDRAYQDNGSIEYGSFVGIHFDTFLFHYYVKHDIERSKQHLSIAGMCTDKMSVRSKGSSMLYNWAAPTSMILSDNTKLLENYRNWDFGYDTELRELGKIDGPFAISNFILRKDFAKAHKAIERYKLSRLYNESRLIPLLALMEGDKDVFIRYIQSILSADAIEKFIAGGGNKMRASLYSEYGTYLLKLAWLMGMEIEIDSPYIPMDLMPIEPLDHYEVPYFFLDGYEGELPDNYKRFLAGETVEAAPKRSSSFLGDVVDDIRNNPKWKGAKVTMTQSITYEDDRGRLIVETLSKDQISRRFVYMGRVPGAESEWIKIREDFTWDESRNPSIQIAYMVHRYATLGYKGYKDKDGDWVFEKRTVE